MLNLIRADFYKAIHGKVLKVCFLMMTGWIFLCAYMIVLFERTNYNNIRRN